MTTSTNAVTALLQGAAVIGLMALALLLAAAVTKFSNWATRQGSTAPEQPAKPFLPAQRTGGER